MPDEQADRQPDPAAEAEPGQNLLELRYGSAFEQVDAYEAGDRAEDHSCRLVPA